MSRRSRSQVRGNSVPSAEVGTKELVLVGGGHAHVQVIRRFMMKPVPGVRLSVVLDRSEAVYSGMVPGRVSGDYEFEDLVIDVLPLARRAGAVCILAAATGIDAVAKTIALRGRPAIPYDVASLDVGSVVRDLVGPGQREYGIATRPIGDFVREVEARIAAARPAEGSPLRVTVVGGGAAGVELAFCTEARLRSLGRAARILLVASTESLLSGSHRGLAPRVVSELSSRSIEVRLGTRVVSADDDGLVLESAGAATERVASDLTLWATGAAAPDFLAESGLPSDEMGFVRVQSDLRVEGQEDLFASGDCARLIDHPWVPRAGVYAVRAGPHLDRNLRARLAGRPTRNWRPQKDFLALLNLGDQRALGGKWGAVFGGHWVWRLKDRIDRRFMRRFQVLDASGSPARDFPDPNRMEGVDEMVCGGCAAKLGPSPLRAALARLEPAAADPSVRIGLAEADDAAVLVWPAGDVVLATVDAFRAFVDDPWLVGRVAAVNAVSDVLAKGARPRHALALVTVQTDTPGREAEALYQVLAGVRAALDPLGISLVGGHSTTGPELFVGLCVTGEPASGGRILELGGLSEGDELILTKPIGTGVLLAADARGLASGPWVEYAVASMFRDNAEAVTTALRLGVLASTDVSGFGLAGHLHELLVASGVSAELVESDLPVLPGVVDLMRRGIQSTFHDQNAALRTHVRTRGSGGDPALLELLFDPQTSGGLLLGVAAGKGQELVEALRSGGDSEAAVIGRVVKAGVAGPEVLLRSDA